MTEWSNLAFVVQTYSIRGHSFYTTHQFSKHLIGVEEETLYQLTQLYDERIPSETVMFQNKNRNLHPRSATNLVIACILNKIL